jgi:hypothetical protein
MELHENIELVIGDEWLIAGTLLDENDQPLDLASVTIHWVLLGPDGSSVPGTEGAVVTPLDPTTSGRLSIMVPEALTRTLNPGRYTDAVRAWVTGSAAQMWRGCILAAADPFHDVEVD